MRSGFLGGALATALLACHIPAAAEDLDLFVQPPNVSAGKPNVLIILDNTANWSRTVDGQAILINEIAALNATLTGLPTESNGDAKFRVGLMMYVETGAGNDNESGAYVRAAVRDMTTANKGLYTALLASFDRNNDKGNAGKAGLAMAEAWRYFKGQGPYAGDGKAKTDYTGNTNGTAQSRAIYALPGNALAGKNSTPYLSPLLTGTCAGLYIIYISNDAAQEAASDTAISTGYLTAAAAAEGISGATTTIAISPSGSQDQVADEWARFMKQSSLNVTTYTVDVDKRSTGQGPGWTTLLRSMAGVSSGKYFDVTSGNGGATIAAALNTIFSEIQAVNSVFASVSLPVSVASQDTYLNQVFIGQFRPDQDAFPRWHGNLKQYKLGILNNALKTLDADGASAINAGTGFIAECARSFWTPSSTDSYWAFKPQGSCLAVANSNYSNFPDGNIVEKGAQAYLRRSTTARTLQTCSATFASCTTLTNFSTGNAAITATMLGAVASPSTERDDLINWQRGLDVDDENLNGVTSLEMRSTVHGDVIHSRPVALDLGTTGDKVVVLYAGNDGVLRAINGNRSASIGSVAAGQELWAFVAPEFYPYIKRLRDNNVQFTFKGNLTTSPVPLPKPYGIDGPISVYRDASNVWINAAMRRGGRALYAFDITNIAAATPSGPTLKWKKGCPNLTNDTDCSSGFDGIGQTWSAARPLKTLGYGSGNSPMLIMGGGHDPCEDADPNTCTSTSKGNKIYLLDANDGTLLRTFTTERPVVADVFVVPDGTTGLTKLAYAADMGGNLYRLSGIDATTPFNATAPASWTMTKIASLGCATTATCGANRKFMFTADVVEKNGVYHVLIGSGDREKPLWSAHFPTANSVTNYFFMLRDNLADPSWLSSESSNCGSPVMCLSSLLSIENAGADPDATDLSAKKGWALKMRPTEQVVTAAITVFGTTTFSSHTPTVPVLGSCTSNLGTARVYNVKFTNAAIANGTTNRDGVISGGGLPPSPVAGMVRLDDGQVVPFLIGGSPLSPLEGGLPSGSSAGAQPKSLMYWFIHK